MRWLPVPTDPRELIAIARLQSNTDFRAGFLEYLAVLRKELSLKSADLIDEVEYRQNQGRLQAVIDLLVLCEKAHEWALSAQAKPIKPLTGGS